MSETEAKWFGPCLTLLLIVTSIEIAANPSLKIQMVDRNSLMLIPSAGIAELILPKSQGVVVAGCEDSKTICQDRTCVLDPESSCIIVSQSSIGLKTYPLVQPLGAESQAVFLPFFFPQQVKLRNGLSYGVQTPGLNILTGNTLDLIDSNSRQARNKFDAHFLLIGPGIRSMNTQTARVDLSNDVKSDVADRLLENIEAARLFSKQAWGVDEPSPMRMAIGVDLDAGFGSSGHVLESEVLVAIGSKALVKEADIQSVLATVAHEVFHVWPSQFAATKRNLPSWFNEGLSEYLVFQFVSSSVGEFKRSLDSALNNCISLLGSHQHKWELEYDCGAVLVHLMAAQFDEGYRGLLASEFLRSGYLSPGPEFLETSPGDAAEFWAILAGNSQEIGLSRIEFEKLAVRAKQPFHIIDSIPADQAKNWGARALMELMKTKCQGSFGFTVAPDGLLPDKNLNCPSFADLEKVEQIGDRSVVSHGHLAYDAVVRSCRNEREVSINGPSVETMIACSANVPPRPAYVSFGSDKSAK